MRPVDADFIADGLVRLLREIRRRQLEPVHRNVAHDFALYGASLERPPEVDDVSGG